MGRMLDRLPFTIDRGPPTGTQRPAGVRRWVGGRLRALADRLFGALAGRRLLAPVRAEPARWSRFPPNQPAWMRLVREIALTALVFPIMRLLYRVDVVGRERLAALDGPVVIAANHCLHLDNPLILMALPSQLRRTTAIAAADDSIFASWRGRWAALFGNAFPISRSRASRRSLARIEAVLANGYSVLIYPEGRLTVGGPMGPFKLGVGFIAAETGTPVVPLYLDVRRVGPAEGRFWPPRGDVRIHVGDLLVCSRDESPSVATARLEAAVRGLSPR
ncbi:MAG: lysophospholipid acyltransferase family protein [Dehalococcoidia bacterium]